MVRRFLSQAVLYAKGRQAAFRWEEFLLLETGYPFVSLVFYCVLAAYSFQTADLRHWVAGNALLLCVNTCLFGLGSAFQGERYNGRLRSILVSPSSLLAVVLESGFLPCLISAGTVLVGFGLGCLVFRVDLSGVSWGLLLPVILAAMFAMAGLGLLLSAISLLGDGMHMLLNCMQYVLMLCTGIQFPVAQLPVMVRWIAYCLPLTRSVRAMDLLLANQAGWLPYLFGELMVGLVYCLLAAGSIELTARAAVRSGKMELF